MSGRRHLAAALALLGGLLAVRVQAINCDVLAVAGGARHSLVLKSDGTVWSWGANEQGQLGNGSTADSTVPVAVTLASGAPLGKVVSIAAGGWFSIAVRSDDTVWAWGSNLYGQLGRGTVPPGCLPFSSRALQVTDPGALDGFLHGIVALAAGSHHVLALRADGYVLAWGENETGQLGFTPGTPVSFPNLVPGVSAVKSIAAGHSHSLALTSGGKVLSWGYNASGQLGRSTTASFDGPAEIPALAGVQAIAAAAGGSHSLALLEDGTAMAWGLNVSGQLGQPASASVLTPASVPIPGPPRIKAIAAGSAHSLALASDGTVLSWGLNEHRQLGRPSAFSDHLPSPVILLPPSSPLDRASLLAAGGAHSLASRAGGDLLAWGDNRRGQLGDGSSTDSEVPVPIDPACASCVQTPVALSGGFEHSLAVHGDGRALAWGSNSDGQLGDGTTSGSNVAVGVLSLTTVIAVAAGSGGRHSLALTSAGAVWAWGWGEFGQLGNGTMGPGAGSTQPVLVLVSPGVALERITAVAAGEAHSLALRDDGHVFAWGLNAHGQLGLGSFGGSEDFAREVLASAGVPLAGVIAIAAGHRHSLALMGDGTVRAWGDNPSGQLGDGTTASSAFPVQVLDPAPGTGFLAGIAALDGGGQHSLARSADGLALAWGLNTSGQLGDASTTSSPRPVRAQLALGVMAIAIGAGDAHSLSATMDLTPDPLNAGRFAMSWGRGAEGQLGDGATADSSVPVGVTRLVPGGALGHLRAVAAGDFHSLALANEVFGVVSAWGKGDKGQLGDGRNFNQSRAVPLAGYEPIPPDQGNVLLAVREGADVHLHWPAAPSRKWNVYRDLDKTMLGTNELALRVQVFEYVDASANPPIELYFYRIKGLSVCNNVGP